jgi:ABC-type sugar transport system substrate-binding protein
MKIWPIAAAAVSAVLLAGGVGQADRAPRAPRAAKIAAAPVAAERGAPVRVGLVLKALDNPFFVALYQGARAGTTRLNVRLTVRAVPGSDDLAGQAAQLRAALAEREDCYVVNPATATNLVSALRGVRRPIVNVDSPIDRLAAKRAGVRIRVFIGTDDFAGGRVAASRMASLLPGGGDVALIGGFVRSVNSDNRLRGFEAGIPGSRLRVAARAHADYDRTKAETVAERILLAHPHISGFFAANDLMALGVADAVRAAGKAGRIRVIGYDGIAEAVDAVAAGSIDATVSQYPYVMGQMAVEACVAAARGIRLPATVDPPIALLSKGNIARAIGAFPKPFQRYADPFTRLLRRPR